MDLYYSMQQKDKVSQEPTWHEVNKGILKGIELFVKPENLAFQEMINGEHDMFFWNYISSTDISGALVIDVGAHIGYHSMAFLKLIPGVQQVVAFEPNPYNVERFDKILGRNGDIKNKISIRQIALSDQSGTTNFTFSKNVDDHTSSGSHLSNISPPQDKNLYEKLMFQTMETELSTLDVEIDKINPESIALIKVDVEGAEQLVLQGAKKTIEKFQPHLLMEIHSVECMLEVGKLLESFNYDYHIINVSRASRAFIACNPKSTE